MINSESVNDTFSNPIEDLNESSYYLNDTSSLAGQQMNEFSSFLTQPQSVQYQVLNQPFVTQQQQQPLVSHGVVNKLYQQQHQQQTHMPLQSVHCPIQPQQYVKTTGLHDEIISPLSNCSSTSSTSSSFSCSSSSNNLNQGFKTLLVGARLTSEATNNNNNKLDSSFDSSTGRQSKGGQSNTSSPTAAQNQPSLVKKSSKKKAAQTTSELDEERTNQLVSDLLRNIKEKTKELESLNQNLKSNGSLTIAEATNKLSTKPNELEQSYLNSHRSPVSNEVTGHQPQNNNSLPFNKPGNINSNKKSKTRSSSSSSKKGDTVHQLTSQKTVTLRTVSKIPLGWSRTINNQAVTYTNPIGHPFHSINEIRAYLLADNTCKCGLECPLNVNETFNFDSSLVISQNNSSLTDTSNNQQVKKSKEARLCCAHKPRLSSKNSSENIFSSSDLSVKKSKRAKVRHIQNKSNNLCTESEPSSALNLKNAELIRSLDNQHNFRSSLGMDHNSAGSSDLLENLDWGDSLEFIQDSKDMSDSVQSALNLTTNNGYGEKNNNGFDEFDALMLSGQDYHVDFHKAPLDVSQNQHSFSQNSNINFTPLLTDPNYLFFEWHGTFPLLAIASYSNDTTGQIHLHFEEGEHDDAAIIQRVTSPSRMIWHPKKKILIATWEGGEITTWNDNTKRLESFIGVHQTTVCSISWSSNGTRLITGDENGLTCVWKTDANGKLVQPPLNQFNINEKVTDIICKPSSVSQRERELHELAKAAIAGDESALELFEYRSQSNSKSIGNKKNKIDTKNIFMGSSEAICFLVSGDNGSVYFVNENAKFHRLYQMESGITKLLYSQDKHMLFSITDNLMFGQYSLKTDTDAKNIMTVKLNGKLHEFDFCWISSTLLAYVSGESIVRVLDIEKDENFTLALSNQFGYSNTESILSITYSAAKGIIAAGTNKGNVAMWKYTPNKMKYEEPESSWQLLHAKLLQPVPITKIKFGTNLNLLCANLESDAFILSEQKMSSDFRDGLAAVQLGPTIIHLAFFKQHLIKEEKVDIQFKGLATAKNHIVVWNGKIVKVFEMIVNQNSPNLDEKIMKEEKGNFSCAAFHCAIYEQNIYTLEPGKVNIRTFQGTVKQVLQFTENEGDPFLAAVNGTFIAIGTTQGVVKVFDLSRREAKAIGGFMNLKQKLPNFDAIKDLGVSCDGYKVTMTILKRNNQPDSNLYIWNIDKDSLGYFDFEKGYNDVDDEILASSSSNMDDKTAYEKSKIEISKEVSGRYPGVHYWEHFDPRLLVCEIYALPNSAANKKREQVKDRYQMQHSTGASKTNFSFATQFSNINTNQKLNQSNVAKVDTEANSNRNAECLVVSIFFNPDEGLLVYDSYARGEIYSKLISVRIPYHFFVTKGRMVEGNDQSLEYVGYQVPRTDLEANSPDSDKSNHEFLFYSEFLAAKIMRDFIGMTKADANTTDALLNFSYYLTIGDMDEAFKAIKLIKKESVWENMAQMCVKSHRIDVAKHCLGNMGNVKGIKLLREEVAKGADSDTQIAIIALNLGMVEEAEKLLISGKRYDLLNKLYQNMDQWSKALDIANRFDRIHLRNTCYNYAKFCEERNDLAMAIEFYEKSDTHKVEVPRMFLDRDELINLQKYTEKVRDKELFRWWGHYFESMSNMENAITCYKQAGDNLSLCRVFCYNDNIKAAIELCTDSNDAAACYHLARQFERTKNYKEAINYYQRAGAISNAIRICKENDMQDYLANLAFQGSSQDMLDAARYYETVAGQEDKAVILYHKAGHTTKAIDLAFRANKYSELALITDGLTEKSDPLLIRKVADFFMENEQFDKAVDLLAVSKRVDQALELLVKHNVPITEQLAEKLSPKKPDNQEEMHSYYSTLEMIGDAAFDQRLYTIAAKKYTEANNRTKAMKALMKSGDTSRVIFFANIQKQRETYIMAANYLQSLDWRKDPEIMKHIINFYTRAKSMESLSSFYEACAQVEIDEFQDYEKAVSALAEAYKCLTRGNVENEIKAEDMVNNLKIKLTLIQKFIQAKAKLSENAEEGLRDLQQLLQIDNLNFAVRIGDVYSLIIEYHSNRQRWQQAFAILQEMRETIPETSIRYYVNPQLLATIHRELNIEYKMPNNAADNVYGNKAQMANDNENEDEDDIRDNIDFGTYED